MEHEIYEEWISADLDGALSPAQHAQLEAHLNACPSCAQLYRELSQLSQDLHGLAPEVPPQLHQQILEGLPPQKAAPIRRFPRSWKAWGGMAACLALVAVLGYASLHTGQNNLPQAASRTRSGIAPAASDAVPGFLSVPGGDTVLLLSSPLSQGGQELLDGLSITPLEDGSLCCIADPDTAAALMTFLDGSGAGYTLSPAPAPDGSGNTAVVWPAG